MQPVTQFGMALTVAALMMAACGHDEAPPSPPAQPGPYFSVFPVAEADYTHIVPLGNLNPTGHTLPTDHFYIYIRPGPPNTPAEVAVVAPGDIVITGIQVQRNITDNFSDYGMEFQPATSHLFRGRFGHMFSLHSTLSAVMDGVTPTCGDPYLTGGKVYQNCQYRVRIAVAAGAPLGTTGGRAGQYALDFWAYDFMRPPNTYADPARYAGTDLPYAVCAVDYFFDPPRATLETRFGNGFNRRTAAPVCGTVAQDLPGTAQGNWFRDGYPDIYPEDNHLALVHDNIDPTRPVFSVGTRATGVSGGRYIYTPANTGLINRDFSAISADGQIYCFNTFNPPRGIILLHMPDSATLWLEGLSATTCGSGPWSFTAAKAVYLR